MKVVNDFMIYKNNKYLIKYRILYLYLVHVSSELTEKQANLHKLIDKYSHSNNPIANFISIYITNQ